MKFKCPECGRLNSSDDKNLNRPFKCQCKHSFLIQDSHVVEEASEPSNEIVHPTGQEPSNFFEEETFDQGEIPSEISDTDIHDYLNNLKSSKTKIVGEEEKQKQNFDTGEINPQQDIEIQMQPGPEENAPAEAGSNENEAEEEENEKVYEQYRISQARRNSSYREPWWTPLTTREGIIISSTVGGFLFVGLVLLLIFSGGEEEYQEDPYLSALLEGSKKEVPIEEKRRDRKKKVSETVRKPQPKKTAALPRTKTSPPDQLSLSALLTEFKRGNFDRVVSSGLAKDQSNLQEKALIIEAAFLSEKTSSTKKEKLSRQLVSLKSSHPSNASVARAEAVWLLRTGSSKERAKNALKILQSLKLTRPDDPFVPAYMSFAFRILERPDLAIASLREAQNLDGKLVWLLSEESKILQGIGKYQEALGPAQKLARLKGYEVEGLQQMARIKMHQGRYPEAIAHLEQSFSHEKSYELAMEIANLKADHSSNRKALRYFDHANELASSATQKRRSLYSKAMTLCDLKVYEQASAHFYKAYKADPSFERALLSKGKCEKSGKRFSRASRTYQLLLKRAPQNSTYWLLYAQALRRAGRPKAAKSAAERSLKIKPSSEAHYELALLLLRHDRDRSSALVQARKAHQLAPQNLRIKKLLAELQ